MRQVKSSVEVPDKPCPNLSHIPQLWPLQVPLFGICTMDPTFKVDLEPFYSCSSSSYLKDHLQRGSQGPVAPLLMGRTAAAAGPPLLTLFNLFLSSVLSLFIFTLAAFSVPPHPLFFIFCLSYSCHLIYFSSYLLYVSSWTTTCHKFSCYPFYIFFHFFSYSLPPSLPVLTLSHPLFPHPSNSTASLHTVEWAAGTVGTLNRQVVL